MYTYDNISLFQNGKRWFPIMGEIHYSRYPKEYWHESLNKMKAGGVNIVSAYVIWIHHEEIENQYDFSGSKDLHGFVQACKDCGMKLLLRIGPWSHGEVRNGGFPDWLLKKDFEVRTNDSKYFETVNKWYKKIYEQVKDFICSPEEENNTIIGVQIENEFGHCGGLYDETGELHMETLKKMAEDIGFKVPLYTATGWGGARTGGLLPVMGGYCDAPWDPSTEEIESSGNYIFTHERNDHNIGSDHGFGYGITFDMNKFPYLTAELGGGLQVTQHRRTIASSQDIGSVSLVKLGSGVNLLGYYMYHGGTNPDGKLTTLQESKETGYPNDLPVKSYDFRAPVREFGQISETLRELKLLSYFVQDFGSELCELPANIPEDNPLKPTDSENLRYSFRTDGKKGYLFINNYVRHRPMAEHKNLKLKTPEGTDLPELNIKDRDYFFVPFNMTYGNSLVKSALVTPFCKLGTDTTVFYARKNETKTTDLISCQGTETPVFLILSREDALNAWKIDSDKLFITEGSVVENENKEIVFTGRKSLSFYANKELENIPEGFAKKVTVNKNIAADLPAYNFYLYEKETPPEAGNVSFNEISSKEEKLIYKLDISSLLDNLKTNKEYNDCFINISYEGESARLYGTVNGQRKLIFDHFYLGKNYSWEIGLKRLLKEDYDFTSLELEITPLLENQKIYLEEKPEFKNGKLCSVGSITYDYEVKTIIK